MFTYMQLKKVVLLIGMLFLFVHISYAQEKTNECSFNSYFQVGFNTGTSLFFGDIKQYQYWPASSNDISEWKFAGGLNVNYQFTPVIGLRLNGMYGRLTGMRSGWNTYFESDYWETNLNTTFNFSNIFGKIRTDRFLNVYGTIGLGIVQYNTEVKTMYEHTVIRKVGHGRGSGINGRTLQGIMLYGLGLDFRVNDKWNIQLESANRVMDSDMLDGTISGYPLDFYNYTSVGVTYKFGFREKSKEQERIDAMEEYYKSENTPDVQDGVIPVIISDESQAASQDEMFYGDLEYRVQILAKFEGPLSVKSISTKYLIPMYEIKEESYKGYLIYTVGSFKTYEEARKKRDELRRLFEITDAFVVAFDEGSRLESFPEIK